MAELKRFIHTSSAAWKGVENKAAYNNSIVFIHDGDKGVSIYTQGATFDTELTAAEVEPMVKAYLEAGQNVTITEKDGKLVIAAPGTTTITAKSTELVQAKAVAAALTTPMSLALAVDADGKKGTFSQNFKTLSGDDAKAASAVIAAGTNISFKQTSDGLEINSSDTTYSAGTGLTLAKGNVFNHTNSVEGVSLTNAEMAKQTPNSTTPSFTFKTYGYDDQGHILGSKDATVELPATAFKDTTYEVTMAAGNSNEVSLNTKKDGQAESTYTIKGDKGTTVSFANNVMTISSETASDILGTLNVTDTAVANEYVSEVDQTNGKISVTRAKLPVVGVDETKVDGLKLSLSTDGKVGLVDDGLAADLTSKNITLETAETATEGYLKTYILKQGTTEIGKIDLPKELVVTGGSVVEKDGEKYLRLTIANQETPVDIAVKDLVDVYTAGNGIAISDANVVSAKVKAGETYLKVDENGLYTEGIDTAISTAIQGLDSEKSDSAEASTKTNIVNVVTGVTVKQTDGELESVTITETEVATAAYVDAAIAALDVTGGTIGSVAEGTDTVNVIDTLTWSETDGKVSISGTKAVAATKAYVDSKAAAATTKVVKSTDTESVKYLDVTSTTETNGSTTYTVKVSGVDAAISAAINDLDSSVAVDTVTGGGSNEAHDGLMFERIEETNGKLDASKTTVKYVDQAKLTNSSLTGVKYIGINKTDTISQAFEKCESAWDWGTI